MSFPSRKAIFAAFLSLSAFALPARAGEFTAAQKSEIESIVHSYLLDHPEVLRDVANALEKKQQQEETALRHQAIEQNKDALFHSSFDGVVGNPNGKVTLVEFFDYNCGYCKRALGDLENLIKAEPDLRVVLADFPVLGPDSVEASRVAAAVRKQISGAKFFDYHQKLLMTRGHVGKEQALAVAQGMGLDMARVQKDMKDPSVHAGLAQTMKVADALGLNGTPSYVIGDEAIVGAVGYDQLKSRVDSMAKCGKTTC
ncbi:DsbA family protein [Rhodoblastus acidophilus]|uniref:DsbA family protein n=1 Tax=Candidatus Rhodoblastus alkanivorans TaxID=2954117 RepID=A0ABS9Z7G6_9HYPH|nr:DsbA family protein [Candidatus Rhodoblastus alkanivorans]MCI4678362.1 DsbA family protein [Candidatus Rhodoblastus alkanivorans]MCI4683620.1 DsbA family protein [Candidatus Rhodoblastus alkanivorans]MDI4640936.1 DsbA family protein [Rhodoblastus acidophilus]